jgi:hypothetical protein
MRGRRRPVAAALHLTLDARPAARLRRPGAAGGALSDSDSSGRCHGGGSPLAGSSPRDGPSDRAPSGSAIGVGISHWQKRPVRVGARPPPAAACPPAPPAPRPPATVTGRPAQAHEASSWAAANWQRPAESDALTGGNSAELCSPPMLRRCKWDFLHFRMDSATEAPERVCILCLDSDPPPIQSGCACRSDTGLAHLGCRKR